MPSTSRRSIDSVRPAAGIVAGDHAEFRAEQRVEHLRHQRGVRGRAGSADDHLALGRLLDGLDRALVPGRADALLLADRADPVELERVVARADRAEQRVHGDVVGEGADGAAVAVGGGVDRRRRGEPAGRRLVLRR